MALGPLPPDKLAVLAVLRRAPSTADRGPEVRAALNLLGGHDDAGIHLEGARLLRRHAVGAMVLIPQDRVGSHDPGYGSSIRRDLLVLHHSRRVPRSVATVRRPDAGPAGKVTGVSLGTVAQLRQSGIVNSARVGTRWRIYGLVPDVRPTGRLRWLDRQGRIIGGS